MASIHSLSYIHPTAKIGDEVRVGPFCYIEEGVVIGDRTILDSHVTVKRGTVMGTDNFVGQGAVIGGDPQDRRFDGSDTFLIIGSRNTFREYVTIHRATGEGKATVVGDDNFLMAYSHLGHNVTLYNNITIANATGISGHVTIEDMVTIGGMTGVHQFVRIGKSSMIGGFCKITRDAPPFMLTEGQDQGTHDINAVGLRRIGITQDARLALHKACKLLYKSQLGLTHAIESVRREVLQTPEVEYLLAFEERRFKGKNGRGDQR